MGNGVHEPSHKKLDMMANVIVALLFILTAIAMVLFYQKTFYGNGWLVYQNDPFPTSSEVYTLGDRVEYEAEIVRSKPFRKNVSRTIQTACGDVYDLPLIKKSAAGDVGTFEFTDKTSVIPEWFEPCPRAWIQGISAYKPNEYRVIEIPWQTQEFEIVSK